MESFEIKPLGDDRVRFRVRVAPGAKRANIGGTHDGALKIAVTAPPEKGKANQAVVKSIATALGIGKRNVVIVSGQTSRLKTIEVADVSMGDVKRRLSK